MLCRRKAQSPGLNSVEWSGRKYISIISKTFEREKYKVYLNSLTNAWSVLQEHQCLYEESVRECFVIVYASPILLLVSL